MENKMRYWFVAFNYATKIGFGNGNLGYGADSFNANDINIEAKRQSPESLPNSIVITNFIEMTEEDYNEFWKK